MRVRRRVERLERLARLAGSPSCEACRSRIGGIEFVYLRRGPDGVERPETPGPLPCPACGATPELIIEVVEQVVVSRDEAEYNHIDESAPGSSEGKPESKCDPAAVVSG